MSHYNMGTPVESSSAKRSSKTYEPHTKQERSKFAADYQCSIEQSSSHVPNRPMTAAGKCLPLFVICLLFAINHHVQCANDFSLEDGQLIDLDLAEMQQGQQQHQQHETQQGSWSHWWSYDGVSGPDYWNINKHWRLCSLGRKQSPINIKTERLVYDHLLGPLALDWQPGQSVAAATAADGKQQQAAGSGGPREADQKTIPVRLINSGRGIEVWLERAAPYDSPLSGSGTKSATPAAKTTTGGKIHLHNHNHNEQTATMQSNEPEQLILARGPLAYEYKLFKIELHSGASYASAPVAPSPVDDAYEPDENEPSLSSSSSFSSRSSSSPLPKSSEHLINGRPFEAELQLHFYNRHLASGAQEALRWANERPLASLFAIISVFVSLRGADDDDDDKTLRTNQSASEPLGFLLDHLAQLQNQADSMEMRLSRAQLESLLPDTKNYVTYQGSLNRPPCAENVDWIILNKALLVDGRKFAQLFGRQSDTAGSLLENVRPVRPAYGRLLRTTISNLALGQAPSSRSPPGATKCMAENNPKSADCANATRDTHRHLGSTATRTRAGQQQHCSMKPSYTYQYSYVAAAKGF